MIDFKSLHYDVDEAAGQAIVTVERVGGVGGAVSIDYQASDGSATAGADYASTSGTLTWAAGDSGDKTFTVPVTWDGRAEGTESISLALTNPGGGADQGPNSAAVIRIDDDGASGPLALSANAYQVGEADGLVTITVTRSGGSSAARSRSITRPATPRRPRAPTTRPLRARSPSLRARRARASPST
jgi:hypothetical protein